DRGRTWRGTYVVPRVLAMGKARDATSAAAEGGLVAAAFGVLVDEVGVAIVGVVAVVIGTLGDLVELIAVIVLVAHGRLVGVAAIAVGAGRHQSKTGDRANQGEFRHRHSPTPW